MRSLQSALKAILILLVVLVLDAPSWSQVASSSSSSLGATASVLSVSSGFTSGVSTLKTLSLEDDFAVLASSPDPETASTLTSSTRSASFAASTAATVEPASSENIAIRAVNPGYTESTGKNSGELIELVNLNHPNTIALDGLALIYTSAPTTTNFSGTPHLLYEFPVGARLTGSSILFRFADSPEATPADSVVPAQDLIYDTSLAMSGSLTLKLSGEILSSVCWLGGEDCLPVFSTTVKSRLKTTILRNDITGEYTHTNNYTPLFDPENSGLYLPPVVENEDSSSSSNSGSNTHSGSNTNSGKTGSIGSSANSNSKTTSLKPSSDFNPSATSICQSLEFSEILSYYADDASEQFIEFYNASDRPLQIQSSCKLRYKNKLYDLTSSATAFSSDGTLVSPETTIANTANTITVPAYGYLLYRPEVKLTKNPTSDNLYELFDINGEIVDSLSLPHGQKSGTSYAQTGKNADGSENWQLTYNPTPGAANIYQEFRTCPAGKVLNEATGNCVNATTLNSTLKDCGEGKYRNPETGRCKSYSSSDSDEPTPCKDGYERNPETGRCRKITSNNGADYPLVPITDTEKNSSFIALWAIIGIAALGAAYVLFQFRREILYFLKKHLAKLRRK